MPDNQNISILPLNQIRRVWHKDQWYYSVLDVITVLTGSRRPDIYWLTLKKKLKSEGFNVAAAQIEYLKLEPSDGRLGHTVTANRATLQRFIQSIPSSKAMPLYQWLAQVGDDFREIDPQQKLYDQMRESYRVKGFNQELIELWMHDVTRNGALLAEWQRRGVEDPDQLTLLLDEIYKDVFDLKNPSLPGNNYLARKVGVQRGFTTLEAALVGLGQAVALILHDNRASRGFAEILEDVQEAGEVLGEISRNMKAVFEIPVIRQETLYYEDNPTQQMSMFDPKFRRQQS